MKAASSGGAQTANGGGVHSAPRVDQLLAHFAHCAADTRGDLDLRLHEFCFDPIAERLAAARQDVARSRRERSRLAVHDHVFFFNAEREWRIVHLASLRISEKHRA
jgi:hypothetical protein